VERGQRIGLIGAALIVAALAFILLSGDDDDEDTTPADNGTQPTLQEPTASVPAPGPAVETIRVVDGEPEGGVRDITVGKDDSVRFKVESEGTSGEIHLHGYDLMKDVEAGGSVTFSFKADIEGVFEVELEETKTPIAELSVEP
jgi:hypothetical protein